MLMHSTRRDAVLHLAAALASMSDPAPVPAQPKPLADSPPMAEPQGGAGELAWAESLPARLEAVQAPGLAWALIDAGLVVQRGAWGFADLAKRQAMRADTLNGVASVTKTFTAALVMQWVEQGRVALDDAVDTLLPFALRNPAHPQAPVTLRHLLTHTSGLADDAAAYEASYACGDPRQPLADWLAARLAARLEAPFTGTKFDAKAPFHADPPGARHAYSNVGYGLLGLIVERLAGRPFEAHLREALLGPLGMARSHMALNDAAAPGGANGYARPYEFVAKGQAPRTSAALRLPQAQGVPTADGAGYQQPLCLYSFATVSDGLLRSSADELARFALAMLNGGALNGHRVLRHDSVLQMLRAQSPAVAGPPNYVQGLAWRGLGRGVWAHFGRDPGVAAALAIRPQDGRGVVLLTNGSRVRGLLGQLVTEWMAT